MSPAVRSLYLLMFAVVAFGVLFLGWPPSLLVGARVGLSVLAAYRIRRR